MEGREGVTEEIDMAIRNADVSQDPEIARLQRKRDQEWEMAGLARLDNDKEAEAKHIAKARGYAEEIRVLRHAL